MLLLRKIHLYSRRTFNLVHWKGHILWLVSCTLQKTVAFSIVILSVGVK